MSENEAPGDEIKEDDAFEEHNSEPVPNWVDMTSADIYDAINPFAEVYRLRQKKWKANVVGENGSKVLIGIVGNSLIKEQRQTV